MWVGVLSQVPLFRYPHTLSAGINLYTALDDSYWSSLEARAGRIRPDHFLRSLGFRVYRV